MKYRNKIRKDSRSQKSRWTRLPYENLKTHWSFNINRKSRWTRLMHLHMRHACVVLKRWSIALLARKAFLSKSCLTILKNWIWALGWSNQNLKKGPFPGCSVLITPFSLYKGLHSRHFRSLILPHTYTQPSRVNFPLNVRFN